MAGLLDILNTDEGRLAMGLLAAAAPTTQPTNMAARMGMAVNTAYGLKDQATDRDFRKLQMDSMTEQVAASKRKNDLINGLLGGMQPGQPAPIDASSAALGAGAQSGSVGPTVANAQRLPQSAGFMGAMNPDKLAMLKMGAGIDLADIYKLTQPDMQVSNGYAYDRTKTQPGFLPQLNIARDGQASMVQIGPDGLPVVSAPTGAYNTYAGYKNIEENTRANFDPVTVTPQGQSPQMTTRGAIVRNPIVSGAQVPAGVQATREAERKAILEGELKAAQDRYNAAIAGRDQSAASRAQGDIAALNRELGKKGPTVGLPLQSDEEKKRAELGVEGDAKNNADMTAQASQSRDVVANINRARELLKLGPTASGAGALTDKGLSFFGMSTTGANVAAALDNVAGWLTSNIPRMEGPQSDKDVANYRAMAANVGNRDLPVSQRVSALDELERMQRKYEKFNGPNTGSTVPGQQPAAASNVVDQLPKTAPKGTKARDKTTGEILEFNGLSWVKVKQ